MEPVKKAKLKLNKEFRIVFTCNKRHFLGKYMRTFIGAGSIKKYVGADNAITAITGALNSEADKFTIKFRKFGRLEFYTK